MLDTAPLLELLKAPSKQALDDFLCGCATDREQAGAPTSARVEELAKQFELTVPRARELQRAGVALVGEALYTNPTAEQLADLFPADFHPDLRALLLRVLGHRRDEWRAESLASGGVSALPRLQGTSWQAYRKPTANGTTTPAVLISLQVKVRVRVRVRVRVGVRVRVRVEARARSCDSNPKPNPNPNPSPKPKPKPKPEVEAAARTRHC